MKPINVLIEQAQRLMAEVTDAFRLEGDARIARDLLDACNEFEAGLSSLKVARMDRDVAASQREHRHHAA